MARVFDLIDLVTRCKQRADMENNDHISDEEWKSMISTVYAELYERLVASGLRYFETSGNIVTTGVAEYTLPSNHWVTVGVDYVDSGGSSYALSELMAQERNAYSGVTGAARALSFSIYQDKLKFFPTPPSGQTYRMTYVPPPTELTDGVDTLDVDVVLPAGEDFIIWGVVRMALAKEEADTTHAEREFLRAMGRVEEMAQLRALHEARRRMVGGGPWLDYEQDPADWGWGRGW